MIINLLLRFLKFIGLQNVLILLLLWLALGSVAWGVSDVVRGLEGGAARLVVMGGALVGWELARRKGRLWLAVLGGMAAGVMTVALFVAGVWQLLLAWLWGSGQWLWYRLYGIFSNEGQIEYEGAVGEAWQALWDGTGAIVERFIDWLSASTTGEAVFDPLAAALVWGIVLWIVALWAGWVMRQRQVALEALLPAGILLLTTLSFFVRSAEVMLFFLAATLILIALTGQLVREEGWAAEGISYSEEIKKDLLRLTLAISCLLALLASVMPSPSIWEFAQSIQRTFIEPLRESELITALLELDAEGGGVGTIALGTVLAENRVYGGWQAPILPRSHLIGSGPELSEQVVMLIQTDDLTNNLLSEGQASPRYYWRSLTYDRYMGDGWMTSETERVGFAAGEAAIGEGLLFHRLLKQQVEVVREVPADNLLYIGGSLQTVNQDFSVAFRSHDDLFGGLIASSRYEANLLVPDFKPKLLAHAGSSYPKWIEERYLALPEEMPRRVLSLANLLTSQAESPYDKARAIESYLKRFPYTLDLPAPPPERDLTDYFLFELQRGYCDYYATSMVILARAAGIPARLAMGYASGLYDEEQKRYIVTEADAHSWAELYFPSLGWQAFEPTGGGDALERSRGNLVIAPSVALEKQILAFIYGFSAPWWLGLLTIMTIVLGVASWLMADIRHLRRQLPAETIPILYQRLKDHAQRLELSINSGETPYEMAFLLSSQLEKLARENKRWAKRLAPATEEIEQLTSLYVRLSYASYQPDIMTQEQVIKNWLQLRQRLWLAWLVNVF